MESGAGRSLEAWWRSSTVVSDTAEVVYHGSRDQTSHDAGVMAHAANGRRSVVGVDKRIILP
jgi:hypothetical protein